MLVYPIVAEHVRVHAYVNVGNGAYEICLLVGAEG